MALSEKRHSLGRNVSMLGLFHAMVRCEATLWQYFVQIRAIQDSKDFRPGEP